MKEETPSVEILKKDLSKIEDNALLIGFFKGRLDLNEELRALDAEAGNIIASYIKNNNFKAEKGELKNIYLNKKLKNIVLAGLGEEDKFSLYTLSNLMADASKTLRCNRIESFSIFLDSFNNGKFKAEELIEKTILSSLLGLYKFTKFKTKDKDRLKSIKKITIIANSSSFQKEIEYSLAVADAVKKTRDLVNTPPNVATPEYIANYAKELAKNSRLKCTVFDEDKIKEMKMECLEAVAKGSINKPRLVVLEYYGTDKRQKPVAIVGKGVTFDSGGLNVKPYPYIMNMKDDKGGATAAIHIIEACARLNLPVNVVVVTPLVENMPSGASYRPDDVLTAYNKMTVEVRNTDAEGRLILADALSYADELKPEVVIDISTLTGASMIALGRIGSCFLSNNEELAGKIKNASEKSLEKVWEFPLWPEYEESIKSDVADIKHINEESEAGVIIGAIFLKNFVNSIPWAHIDIASTVRSKTDEGILAKGATGVGVRLMMELLRNWT